MSLRRLDRRPSHGMSLLQESPDGVGRLSRRVGCGSSALLIPSTSDDVSCEVTVNWSSPDVRRTHDFSKFNAKSTRPLQLLQASIIWESSGHSIS